MSVLRPYQIKCVEAVFREWETVTSTMIVIFTGGGKTRIFSEIVKRTHPKRSLVIAHRGELIHQAAKHVRDCGLEVQIEKADLKAKVDLFNQSPVVVASVQTLQQKARLEKFKPEDFGLLVIDECFPAGTLVDGKRIETMRVGEFVNTCFGRRMVANRFRSKPNHMVRVTLEDGTSICCTHGHPIFCSNRQEWIPAFLLDGSCVVSRLTTYDTYVQRMRRKCTDSYEISEGPNYCRSRSLLLEGMFEKLLPQDFFGNDGKYEPEICFTSNDRQESHAPFRDSGKVIVHSEDYGTSPNCSWRERNGPYCSTENVSRSSWVDHRACHTNQSETRFRISDLLQSGCREPSDENFGRRRRLLPQPFVSPDAGPKEGCFLENVRVDSVEILKQTSDGTFGGVCPDGFVYNIEVEHAHHYFANGILVHNCHHSVATTYRKVIDHFRKNPLLKIFSCTATPDRADEKALGKIFDSVAFKYDIAEGINDGWLVPIEQQLVKVGSLDFSHVRTTAGDLNGADLAKIMEDEKNLQGMTGAAIEIIGDRKSICFTASVHHAEMCAEIFNRHRTGMAVWVCGATPEDKRKLLLSDFYERQPGETNKPQVLVNVGVATEGYDCPDVQCIIQGRPTKSRALYTQMVGRGTRTIAGTLDEMHSAYERKQAIALSAKPTCLVLDFVGNSGKHKLMTTADILGGDYSDEVKAMAVKKAEKAKSAVNMKRLLEESEEVIRQRMEAQRRAEEARKARLVAKVQYSTKRVNPFDLFDISPSKQPTFDRSKVLSEKQRAMLLRIGIDPGSVTYAQGQQIIVQQLQRWQKGLATPKQCAVLRKFGYETKEMTFREAKEKLDALANNNWQRPHLQPA